MKYLFYVVFIVFTLASCSKDSPTEVKYEEIPLEEEIHLSSALIVKVDPRIELLSVVQHFTTWADIRHTKYESRYKYYIDKYFKNFSNHDAVKLSQELTNYGFTYDAPPTFVLLHSNPPLFNQEIAYTNYLITRAGSKEKLESFANALRNFSNETDFLTFLETQKSFFRKIENDIKRTIGDRDYIKIIEEYYGQKQKSDNIIPAPLFHAGGYGPLVETSEGNNIYNICGPFSSNKGIPSFGDELYFQYIMLHEFSHSFVNPLSENYRNEVNQYIKLFEPIRSKMENMGYGDWQTCLNEHLVRTNVARFANILQNAEIKNQILKQEYDRGFIYIYGLDSLMQNYESDRINFPSYNKFYIEIIDYLGDIK